MSGENMDYKQKLIDAGLPCVSVVMSDGGPEITFERDLSAAESVIFKRYVFGATWDQIRAARLNRLKACDWTQLADVDLSVDDVLLWRVYRQELRDLPAGCANPDDVIFPDEP